MMLNWLTELAVAIFFYVAGSFPSGYLIARLAGIKDIRQHGSGNIGATNVGRTVGVSYFFLVLFFDFIKAYGALYGVSMLGFPDLAMQWALFLLIGNTYSVFLRGNGGKGVATSAGILAWCFPTVFCLFSIMWVSIVVVTQMPWLASVLAMLLLPCFTYVVVGFCHYNVLLICMIMIVILRHRSNIRRFYYNA